MKSRDALLIGGLFLISLAVCFIAPMIGMTSVPFSAIFEDPDKSQAALIFWKLRLPRVCLAFLAGSSLAICGMTFQAIFQNSLATPFTLGVSGGAAFGATLSIRLGIVFTIFGLSFTSIAAFLGAIASLALVYGIARARRDASSAVLLLAGVAVSLFFSSIIMFIHYTSDFANSFKIVRWLMGGLELLGFDTVFGLTPIVALGTLVLFGFTRELNLLSIGEEIALSRGVDVSGSKAILFAVTTFMVGAVIALCGPIGFIGMMAPHICRLFVGHDHRTLLPASFLFGGSFLVICDTAARIVLAPADIPVGVLTSLLGGPFFILLLVKDGLGGSVMGGSD
jgi:iron complex transport system permease protein